MVRPATLADLADINRLENWAVENTYAHFGLDPVPFEETEQAFHGAQGRYPWAIAHLSGDFAGFARAGAWKDRGAYRWTCEIGVYVAPEVQGKGIGKDLYGVLFPALEEAGCHTVLAGIALPNEASVRLHEAFGMVKVAHLPETGFKFGQWWDTAYWSKTLHSSVTPLSSP
ncbi:MAG: N-acetyltransferase [Fimbriimonadaceae bacterium]|nr:N-acetyltransferase [Fimbriimonadaceae bacterium]